MASRATPAKTQLHLISSLGSQSTSVVDANEIIGVDFTIAMFPTATGTTLVEGIHVEFSIAYPSGGAHLVYANVDNVYAVTYVNGGVYAATEMKLTANHSPNFNTASLGVPGGFTITSTTSNVNNTPSTWTALIEVFYR